MGARSPVGVGKSIRKVRLGFDDKRDKHALNSNFEGPAVMREMMFYVDAAYRIKKRGVDYCMLQVS